MSIIHIQTKTADFPSRELRNVKRAIAEHEPIKLSNGTWLHSYKITQFEANDAYGDADEEQEAVNRELFG